MWPIDRVRRRRHRKNHGELDRKNHQGRGSLNAIPPAILLIRTIASRQEVVQGCERAIAVGIAPGMTLTHARALLGKHPVDISPHDPKADRVALEALAGWATRWAPAVEPDHPDQDNGETPVRAMPGLLADITGCERLYRGESNLLKQLHHAITRLGFHVRIASAPTLAAAWAVARFGPEPLTSIAPNAVLDAVADLPLRGLRVSEKIESAFAQVGIATIGEVLALPRRTLPARFGSALTLRIDQLLGQAIELITPTRPYHAPTVHQAFQGPVKQVEAIETATQQLLGSLCEQLLRKESGICKLDVTLERSDCEPYRITLCVSRFSRDVKHLWSLLRPKVENAHLGYGVEAITLTASEIGLLPHREHEHPHLRQDEAMAVERDLAHAIDTLSNRLGGQAICQAELTESHIPERVTRLVSAAPPKPSKSATKPSPSFPVSDRPGILLPTPYPIHVMAVTPDGPLLQFSWRGENLKALATFGPERLTQEWWRIGRGSPATRDYFKVQDEHGQWWWLYRELETRRWFAHGRWA